MEAGRRVFTDATQSSICGCENSKARLLQKDVQRARYLDPKTSRWLSTDPALGEHIPLAPVNDEAKKHNQNLPGMGGVFNVVNFHLYHYAGNNPVKYIDPDGRIIDTSQLNDEDLKKYNIAITELRKDSRATQVIDALEKSEIIFSITMNSHSNNKYDPAKKEILWDSNKILIKDFDIKEDGNLEFNDMIDSITLLFHELGHAYQDLNGELKLNPTIKEIEAIENDNIKYNEAPVAKSRKNYVRSTYSEFLFPYKYTLEVFCENEK